MCYLRSASAFSPTASSKKINGLRWIKRITWDILVRGWRHVRGTRPGGWDLGERDHSGMDTQDSTQTEVGKSSSTVQSCAFLAQKVKHHICEKKCGILICYVPHSMPMDEEYSFRWASSFVRERNCDEETAETQTWEDKLGGGDRTRLRDQPKASFPPHDVEYKPEIPKHWHPSGCVKNKNTSTSTAFSFNWEWQTYSFCQFPTNCLDRHTWRNKGLNTAVISGEHQDESRGQDGAQGTQHIFQYQKNWTRYPSHFRAYLHEGTHV